MPCAPGSSTSPTWAARQALTGRVVTGWRADGRRHEDADLVVGRGRARTGALVVVEARRSAAASRGSSTPARSSASGSRAAGVTRWRDAVFGRSEPATERIVVALDRDRPLVEAARRDPSQFDALYRKYLAQVYAYALYELADHHAAEDATERTFLRALAALPRFRELARPEDGPEACTFRVWLFRIARNVVANERRTRAAPARPPRSTRRWAPGSRSRTAWTSRATP